MITILLCTKDGDAFLEEQLESIQKQTHTAWRIVASDDRSSDRTLEILEAFSKQTPGRLEIRRGPQQGATQNFLSLAVDRTITGNYFAYCDQDDIWAEDKLARALEWLETIPGDTPALYCSRVRVVAMDGTPIGMSPLHKRPPTFRNALVQSIANGNTMVFNSAARDLLVHAGRVNVVSHDWWTYQLVAGCGGVVRYDSMPSVSYRQHETNEIGSTPLWRGRVKRLPMLLAGRMKGWNERNIQALRRIETYLHPDNKKVLDLFSKARDGAVLSRLMCLRRSGVYRQSILSNLSLVAGVGLKRI